MPVDLRYRGRAVTTEDIVFIRQFIANNPSMSRRKLSAQLCETWQWKQANGALCDMVCRGLLLMLHRAGEIELPAIRQTSLNPFVQRKRPQPILIDMTPLTGALTDIRPISFQQSEEHPTSRCSTVSLSIITISVTSSQWAST